MSEDQLKQAFQAVKSEMINSFKSKLLGDTGGQKALEYLEKLKKQFKQKFESVKKKNS